LKGEGMEKIIVAVSNNDFVVREPQTKNRVTTDGMLVKKSAYWLKRIKSGDVHVVEETKQTVSKPKEKKAKETPSFEKYETENI
jgi:hypothetical protein